MCLEVKHEVRKGGDQPACDKCLLPLLYNRYIVQAEKQERANQQRGLDPRSKLPKTKFMSLVY